MAIIFNLSIDFLKGWKRDEKETKSAIAKTVVKLKSLERDKTDTRFVPIAIGNWSDHTTVL